MGIVALLLYTVLLSSVTLSFGHSFLLNIGILSPLFENVWIIENQSSFIVKDITCSMSFIALPQIMNLFTLFFCDIFSECLEILLRCILQSNEV
jgi:hypothetical protein